MVAVANVVHIGDLPGLPKARKVAVIDIAPPTDRSEQAVGWHEAEIPGGHRGFMHPSYPLMVVLQVINSQQRHAWLLERNVRTNPQLGCADVRSVRTVE